MLFKLLRVKEWISSKISFCLFSIMFILLCADDLSDRSSVSFVLICMLFYFCFIGASYLVNDISDIDIDRRSGKKKVITEMNKGLVILILIAVMAAGTVPFVLYERTAAGAALAAVIYFFGFSYSLKPLRLKERGLTGTVFCSAAQRCIPVLVVLLRYSPGLPLVMILLLNFFIGMRYILIHQLIDRKNDEAAGVSTFSRSHTETARKLLYVNVAAELVTISGICAYLFISGKLLTGTALSISLTVYLIITAVFVRAVRYMLNENIFETFSFVPFEDYYSFFLPLGICIAAGIPQPLWFIGAAAVCVMQFRMMKERTGFITAYFRTISGSVKKG